jgi:hypothetical protein
MRCPHCGTINKEEAKFCARCGRDLDWQMPPNQRYIQQQRPGQQNAQRPPQQTRQAAPQQQSRQQRQTQQPQSPQQQQQQRYAQQEQQHQLLREQNARFAKATATSVQAPVINAPEPPAPFPPKKVEQLKALKAGALPFTVVSEDISNKRKRTVRISYPACTGWQQIATLLQALEQQATQQFETTVIQGVQNSNSTSYAFNNGQLIFDREVLLGSQRLQRYQIETDNGFDAASLRIVLSE